MAGGNMNKIRKKNAPDENFTVGKFINKKLRPLVMAYYKAARSADDIADNNELSPDEKLHLLNQYETAFLNPQKNKASTEASALGQLFKSENLDASLYTDLLKAFRRDAENIRPRIWDELIDYCNYSAVPVGRFMLAIHNENPSTYLPAATLCTVLQIVNHIQDIKYDAMMLRRIYLPEDMCKHYDVQDSDLYLTYSTPGLTELKNEILARQQSMLKDAELLPSIVKNKRLKIELGIILSLTNCMIKKLQKNDILSQEIKLSRTDWIKSSIIGGMRGLFTRKRTVGTIK